MKKAVLAALAAILTFGMGASVFAGGIVSGAAYKPASDHIRLGGKDDDAPVIPDTAPPPNPFDPPSPPDPDDPEPSTQPDPDEPADTPAVPAPAAPATPAPAPEPSAPAAPATPAPADKPADGTGK